MSERRNPTSLSVVIPCHNEEEVLSGTYDTLSGILEPMLEAGTITDYEIVLVNNGSTDSTLSVMKNLHEKDKRVVIVDLRKNFGYQGSISAGLHNAVMGMVVSIDADLQDDPHKIPEMVDRYYDGYDLVLGVRRKRKADTIFKRLTTHAFYKLMEVFGVNSVYNHGDFRLMARSLVDDFKEMGERNRYIRSMVFELESTYATVEYDRAERTLGETKFSFGKQLALALDGITSFSSTPIRLVFTVGLLMSLLAALLALYVVWVKLFGNRDVPGWAFLALLFLLFSGINSLSLGVIGEYIAKTYVETKQRPVFVERQVYRRS